MGAPRTLPADFQGWDKAPSGPPTTLPADFADWDQSSKAGQRGPSAEEQRFLQQNPNYKYFTSDPKFPNRPEGIYPTGPGNEWRSKPDYEQSPVDLHLLRHNYQGAKAGLMMATAPLAMEASLPQIAGGVVGGGVGTVGGQQAAKAAGVGEAGQEVAGDVGGIVGGGIGAGVTGWAADKAKMLFDILPHEVQQALVRKAIGTVSPRAANAADFWGTLRRAFGETSTGELDATGENKPFAGGVDEWRPSPHPLDATGENKPFAGGMDEPPIPRPIRPTARPAPPSSATNAPSPTKPTAQSVPGLDPITGKPFQAPLITPEEMGLTPKPSRSIPKAETPTDDFITRLRAIADRLDKEQKAAPAKVEDLSPQLQEMMRRVEAGATLKDFR